MLLESPLIQSDIVSQRPRWRQLKQACGETPKLVFPRSGNRMDVQWAFREAYDTARQIKEKQDEYCTKSLRGQWEGLGPFPESLKWEALVDVLRGRTKVHIHCYEAVDFDNMVRLSNEFNFSIAAFHHAHEAFLVPDLLKRSYGSRPGVALFASVARYKREAYRGTEFSPKILADEGFKSDHPLLDSRHLIFEAQQAHYYGLSEALALASVTSTPASLLGYGHRVGYIKPGYDADIVIWDSHPLQPGATPKQVIIDGISQLDKPFSTHKPEKLQRAPNVPEFDAEAKRAIKYDGLPPLERGEPQQRVVIFANASSAYVRAPSGHIKKVFGLEDAELARSAPADSRTVVVLDGKLVCISDEQDDCKGHVKDVPPAQWIDLKGGSISPALVGFGGTLGLQDISSEPSTNDGKVIDLLKAENPSILGPGTIARAVDGLQFGTRDALVAYRSGVTVAAVAPVSAGFVSGLGTAFKTGFAHKLVKGAVVQEVTAIHVAIDSGETSISTQIAALRNLLGGRGEGDIKKAFSRVLQGDIPLVVQVQSADIMTSLIQLKKETEGETGISLKMTFIGANEAHLLAKEIGEACIGVLLAPARPYPGPWKSKRILPGPPLSESNSALELLRNNVTVAVGISEKSQALNLRFDVGWVAREVQGRISTSEMMELVTTNVEKALGISTPNTDLVVVEGSYMYDFEGKVVGILSGEEEAWFDLRVQ